MAAPILPSRTALVVENEKATRELLRVHLGNAGYRVLLAPDAIVAGRTLLGMARELDVIVVDAELPYLSGVDFAATLLADTGLPSIPMVMIVRREELAPRAEALGLPCLAIPFSADRLVAAVESVTERTPTPHLADTARPSMREWLEHSERRRAPRAAADAGLRRALRLVVADDEPDTVTSLMAILNDEGHSVFGTYRGGEVIPALRGERPDAVILDIDMPGISGYAVARATRELFRESCPLLIAISGKWTGQTDRMLAEVAGFDHFLRKPCEPAVLLRLLEPLRRPPRLSAAA